MDEKKKILEYWSQNKFLVMEHSGKGFIEAREYLKKPDGKFNEFKELVSEIIEEEPTREDALKSVFQVWELVKGHVSKDEKDQMFEEILEYKKKQIEFSKVKEVLHQICQNYNIKSILESNYFNKI